MAAQDARWLINALESTTNDTSVFALTLFGHASRVVYEGTRLVQDPQLGLPASARLLSSSHAAAIESARHATKLLDDTHLALPELERRMDASYQEHHRRLTGNAVWFARGFETDLAIAEQDGRVIAASIPLDHRFGVAATDPVAVRDLATTLGAALGVIANIGGTTTPPANTSAVATPGEVTWKDRLASRYLRDSYDRSLPLAAKLVLLLVECEVATSVAVLPRTDEGFAASSFRARLIVLFHSLSAVRTVLAEHEPSMVSSAPMYEHLKSGTSEYFLSDKGIRDLRNYAMHFGVRDRKVRLKPDESMFGLVEATTGRTFDELRALIEEATVTLADLLRTWRY